MTCRSCGQLVGLPGDDPEAWALGYHDSCWETTKAERGRTWQNEQRAEAAMRENRRQRKYLRIGAAALVQARKLLSDRAGHHPTGKPRDP